MKPLSKEEFMEICEYYSGHDCYRGCKLFEACLMWNNLGKNTRGRYRNADVPKGKIEFLNNYFRKKKLEKLLS